MSHGLWHSRLDETGTPRRVDVREGWASARAAEAQLAPGSAVDDLDGVKGCGEHDAPAAQVGVVGEEVGCGGVREEHSEGPRFDRQVESDLGCAARLEGAVLAASPLVREGLDSVERAALGPLVAMEGAGAARSEDACLDQGPTRS